MRQWSTTQWQHAARCASPKRRTEGLEFSSAVSLLNPSEPRMDGYKDCEPAGLAESPEHQPADKLIMLMWRSGRSNFKQIVPVAEQQDVCWDSDRQRCFAAFLSEEKNWKPQPNPESKNRADVTKKAFGGDVFYLILAPISISDRWGLLGGLSHTQHVTAAFAPLSYKQWLCLFDSLLCTLSAAMKQFITRNISEISLKMVRNTTFNRICFIFRFFSG